MSASFFTDPYLSAYLSIQVALISSILILRIVRQGCLEFMSHRQWSRLGRGLMLGSAVLPLLVYLPVFHSHHLVFKEVPQLMESYGRRPLVLKSQLIHQNLSNAPIATDALARPTENPFSFTWNELLFTLMILFAVTALVRAFHQLYRLKRFLRSTHVLHAIGPISVVASADATIPFATSIGHRHWVVLPENFLHCRRDLRIMLAHEFQHIRAVDTRLMILIDGVGAFFAPAILMWKRTIIELHELSCDEALIGQNKVSSLDYGSCLVRVAEAALRKGRLREGTACMAADPGNPKRFKSFLRRRIEMFAEYPEKQTRFWQKGLAGTALALGCICTSIIAGATLKPSALPPLNAGKSVNDPKIEKLAKEVLEKALVDHPAQSAFAVIAEPETGRVLAAVSVGDLKESPTAHLIEPASVLKTLLLAEGVQNKSFTLNDSFDCAHGNYKVGDRTHHDWEPFDHLTARKIVTRSSNIGGIKLAEKMSFAGIDQLWNDFGFGGKGSVRDFPGARVGYLAPAEKEQGSQWLPLTGSGIETLYVSPLEIVQAYSAIANGGLLMKAIPAQTDPAKAQIIRRVLSAENAKSIRDVLVEAATRGTGGGRGLSTHYSSAGKTGTTYDPKQKEHETKFGGDENVAHYVGFAPLDQPKVTVYIGLIGTKESPTGSYMAAPVFKQMIDRVLPEMKVKPDLAAFSKI